jgi:starch phosphorylase
MKAALNGGLNLSILDGWWDEWYDGNNGWALPSAEGVADEGARDAIEATALYDLIENEVAPRFYDLDAAGLPNRWIEMVRHTLKSLGPKVLASRMVRDYVDQLYRPAAQAAHALNGSHEGAREFAAWKQHVRAGWDAVHVEHVESHGLSEAPEVGDEVSVRAFVSLGDLRPEDVEVQLVHGTVGHDDDLQNTVCTPLSPVEAYEGGRHRYEGEVALERTGPFGYSVRIVPRDRRLASAAELGLVANAG